MVVAARARDGHAGDGTCGHVNLFVHEIHAELLLVLFIQPLRPECEETGRDEVTVAFLVVCVRQQVARDLLADELVVGLVLIHRSDDVVAVFPRGREGEVPLLARALGIARDIEPVPAPALAELRRREQPIHDFLKGFRRLVLHESLHFIGPRRQADEIEIYTPDQRRAVGIRDGLDFYRLHRSENEAIHIATCPRWILHLGRCVRLRELEGPEFLGLRRIPFALGDGLHRERLPFARIGSTHFDPLLKLRDHIIRQLPAFLLRRHLHLLVLVSDCLHQQAFGDVSRHHGVTRFATHARRLASIE